MKIIATSILLCATSIISRSQKLPSNPEFKILYTGVEYPIQRAGNSWTIKHEWKHFPAMGFDTAATFRFHLDFKKKMLSHLTSNGEIVVTYKVLKRKGTIVNGIRWLELVPLKFDSTRFIHRGVQTCVNLTTDPINNSFCLVFWFKKKPDEKYDWYYLYTRQKPD